MILFFGSFVVLLLIGVPISISIGASAILGCLNLGYPLMVIGQKMVSGIDSFLLIAIPLFILAGNLMNAGKITENIFDFAKRLVGWIPGGLGHANVVASLIFAGMSGSAAADAGGLGTIEMQAMTTNGYDEEFSAGITAASSVIGPIFPPSIPLIIYGSVASVSVSQLFMGGVVPGLLMAVALMVLVFIFAVRRKYERTAFNMRLLIKQFFASVLSIITPLIILSGFVFGLFTPTEASSVAVGYALVIALFVYRTLDWKTFKQCLLESAITSANTLFIIGTSMLFSYVLIKEGVSAQMADFILGISDNPNLILLVINILLLVLGMFMEPGAILTLMLPVLLPIVKALQIDLVHFGVVMILNLMIGQVTPPFGVCLFIIGDVSKVSLNKMYKAILPFIIPLVIVLFMCTYIPEVVTWLPTKLLQA
ncbi:TRAP transporter large permease [Sphaerochaeta globosa]|uniref:TRAP dicarboxylate transporter, DctM subunit n=1 Tax=Sphaerochaeta globosa (strain ATCC BAA-1886 / DSM 22777 / Buddy) TaxID=158189 RepID=F0RW74_SPHGB|nr:TRAP transporter large permease [Sphaerochaeta globosa]ADY13431.1 TRAP dicarboxylate transporter, DctM subunit [Sphaerochaeta globosa str. Buddy]